MRLQLQLPAELGLDPLPLWLRFANLGALPWMWIMLYAATVHAKWQKAKDGVRALGDQLWSALPVRGLFRDLPLPHDQRHLRGF